MHRTPHPATLVLLCLLVAAVAPPATPSARADGDPLEEYDFSGRVPPSGYLQQSYTHAYRYGLWTIQHYTTLDPFEGSYWALRSNTFERVNVYFGTRPLWHSGTGQTVSFEILRPEGRRPRGAFRRIVDTRPDGCDERDPPPPALLPVGDVTGGGGITVLVRSQQGSTQRGSSYQIIRLSGDAPATAKVSTLWSAERGGLEDVNGDGLPEIIDIDFTHAHARYLPHKGYWWEVVLAWDPEAGRYALDPDGFGRRSPQQAAPSARERGAAAAKRAAATERHVASRIASAASYEDVHTEVMITLARGLQDLLWSGQVAEARRLLDAVDLPFYGSAYESGRMDKATWWRAFLAGCRKSRYWSDLCAAFPQLKELE